MSYIGNNLESLGNRSILSLSGSTPATSYTLQKNSANFSTVAENLIVVHQGVIQQPIDSASPSAAFGIDVSGNIIFSM